VRVLTFGIRPFFQNFNFFAPDLIMILLQGSRSYSFKFDTIFYVPSSLCLIVTVCRFVLLTRGGEDTKWDFLKVTRESFPELFFESFMSRLGESPGGTWRSEPTMMMMIAFITIKSSLVPLIEGLCAQIYFRFEISVVCSHLLLFFFVKEKTC